MIVTMMGIIIIDAMIDELITIMMVVIDINMAMPTRMIMNLIAKTIHSEGRGSCIQTKTLRTNFIIVLPII